MNLLGVFWLAAFHVALAGLGAWGLATALRLPSWLASARPMQTGAAPVASTAVPESNPPPAEVRRDAVSCDEALVAFTEDAASALPSDFPCRLELTLAGESPLGAWDELARELSYGSTWERGGGPLTGLPLGRRRTKWAGDERKRIRMEPFDDAASAAAASRTFLANAGDLRRVAVVLALPAAHASAGEARLAGAGIASGVYRATAADLACTLAAALGVAPPPGPGQARMEWFGWDATRRAELLIANLSARVRAEVGYRSALGFPLPPGAEATAEAYVTSRSDVETRLAAAEQTYAQLTTHGHIRRAQKLAGGRWRRFGFFAAAVLIALFLYAVFRPEQALRVWISCAAAALLAELVWRASGADALLALQGSGSRTAVALAAGGGGLLAAAAGAVGLAVLLVRRGAAPGVAGPSIAFHSILCVGAAALALGAVAWLQGLRPGTPLQDLAWLSFGLRMAWTLAGVGLAAPLVTLAGSLAYRAARPAGA